MLNGCEIVVNGSFLFMFYGKYIKHTVFSSVLFQWERGGNVEFLWANVSSLEPWLIECSNCSLYCYFLTSQVKSIFTMLS